MNLSKGQQIQTAEDVVKDTYTLEFLGIDDKKRYKESELEQKLIDNMQKFLLELSKGFAFVGRQYALTVNNVHYHVDLVFYHRILKCFVLIDIKRGAVKHKDIGQMNMYMGYFAKEENVEGDNPPDGIFPSVANLQRVRALCCCGGFCVTRWGCYCLSFVM